jgi:hypothetical protein
MLQSRNRSNGSVIAEYVPAIVVLFLFFIFPFVNLVTSCLRYTLLMHALHDTTIATAQCTTFSSGSGPQAVMDVAPKVLAETLGKFTGFNNVKVHCRVVSSTLSSSPTSTYTLWDTPLPVAADASKFAYCVEVDISADIDPLLTSSTISWLPGIASPIQDVHVVGREIAESPEGLNQ